MIRARGLFRPLLLLGLLVADLGGLRFAVDLSARVDEHRREYLAMQADLRERRRTRARLSAIDEANRAGLAKLAGAAVPWSAFPELVEDLDRRMAARSLCREDVDYARREAAGSFALVRVTLKLSGAYEEFRRFLHELEAHPRIVWVNAVEAIQDKTFSRFSLVLHVLVRADDGG